MLYYCNVTKSGFRGKRKLLPIGLVNPHSAIDIIPPSRTWPGSAVDPRHTHGARQYGRRAIAEG
jgi:hypothetical protein